VIKIVFRIVTKLYIYNTYRGYTCYLCNWNIPTAPQFQAMRSFQTFGRATLGANGFANKLFLAFLFSNHAVGIQFLKDVGLIWSSMVCCKCGSQMSWCIDTNRKVGFQWRCRRITSPSACSASISIRHKSWFQQSNLNFVEVLFLTYIVRSYEHDREHVAACESLPHSLQPDRGIMSIN